MEDRSNTIAGWVLFGMASALGLSILSGKFFHADSPEAPETPGYAIEGAKETAGEVEKSLGEMMSVGAASAGEKVFQKCVACHTIEKGGANGVGPNLYGILGKQHGAISGFSYSTALTDIQDSWSFDNMDSWLQSPKRYANGTKMSFAGLSKLDDRANVILYLNQNSDSPLPVEQYVADALALAAANNAEASAEEEVNDAAGEGNTEAAATETAVSDDTATENTES